MTYELGRSLLLSDAVSPEALAEALCTAASERVSLVRALLSTRAIDPNRLEEELARSDAPLQRHVTPVLHLMEQLPPGLCQRLLAVPVRRDPRTGTVDVAVADARDEHAAEEIAFFLRSPVRLVRAPLSAIEEALGRPFAPQPLPAGIRPLAAPMATPPPPQVSGHVSGHVSGPVRSRASTPLWGTPIVRDERDEDVATSAPPRAHEAHAQPDARAQEDGWSIPPEELAPVSEIPASEEIPASDRLAAEMFGVEAPPLSEIPASAPAVEIPIPLSRRAVHVDFHEPDHGLAEVVASAFPAPQPFAPSPSSVFPASRRLVLAEQEEQDEDDEAPQSGETDALEDDEDEPVVELRRTKGEVDDEPVVELRRTKSGQNAVDTAALRAHRIDAILREMQHADDRDALLDLILVGARTVARKAALFVVKRDGYVGWTCTEDFGDSRMIRAVKVDPRAPTFLARAAAAGSYAGAVLPSEANASLLNLFVANDDGEVEVACAAVRPGGRTAVVIVTYDLTEPLAAIVQLEEIAAAAAEGFERILLTRR